MEETKIKIEVQRGENKMIVEFIRPEKVSELAKNIPFFADLIGLMKKDPTKN